MSAQTIVFQGTVFISQCTFTDPLTGDLVDPEMITCEYGLDGSDSPTTATYPAEIARASQGVYQCSIDSTPAAGLYKMIWDGQGGIQVTQVGYQMVKAPKSAGW